MAASGEGSASVRRVKRAPHPAWLHAGITAALLACVGWGHALGRFMLSRDGTMLVVPDDILWLELAGWLVLPATLVWLVATLRLLLTWRVLILLVLGPPLGLLASTIVMGTYKSWALPQLEARCDAGQGEWCAHLARHYEARKDDARATDYLARACTAEQPDRDSCRDLLESESHRAVACEAFAAECKRELQACDDHAEHCTTPPR